MTTLPLLLRTCSSQWVKRVYPPSPGPMACALALMLGTASLSQAAAQTAASDDDGPILAGNILSTPVVQGRAWTLEGRFGARYDSNFRRRADGEAAWRLSPLVHFGAGMPFGRQQLFFGADLGRDIIINQKRFSRGRYAVGGGVEWRLGNRCSGVVGAEAIQRQTFVTEQAELVENAQKSAVFGGSVGCRTATGLSAGGSFERRNVTNDSEARAPFDLRSTIFAPNISYGNPTLGQFSLSGTFNSTDYSNRLALTPDGLVEEGIRIFNGRLGYSRTFGTRLSIGLGLSYIKTDAKPAAVIELVGNQLVLVPRDTFSGSGYDGSISYQPSSRMNFNLVASRNVNVSPNVGAQFIIRNSYGADLGYRFGPSINFATGGRIAVNQYRNSFTTPGEQARNRDNIKRVYASLDYAPVPLYSVGVEIAHQWRRSDPEIFSFDSTTARLNLRVKLGRG